MAITSEDIIQALETLGGEAHLKQITDEVAKIAAKPLAKSYPDIVRRIIQESSSSAKAYKPSNPDLFTSVYGVDANKGVWRLNRKEDVLDPQCDQYISEQTEEFISEKEGIAKLRVHLRRERSSRLIKEFKSQLKNHTCECCGFDFSKKYGELGVGYIEAHHSVPVAKLNGKHKVSVSDLIALCANCHRMIHRNGLISLDELRSKLKS